MSEITLRLAQHLRAGDAELGLVVEHIALAGKFIAREIARASRGGERIQDIQPTSVHQRVPLLIGSRDDVTLAEEFVAGRSPETAR